MLHNTTPDCIVGMFVKSCVVCLVCTLLWEAFVFVLFFVLFVCFNFWKC